MNSNLPPKQIDELVEVIDLNKDGADLFIVNVFSDVVGYKLTKKVRLDTLANHIVKNYVVKSLSDEYLLSSLAHETKESLIKSFLDGLNPNASLHTGVDLSDSLVLSTYTDLNLGDLATLNLSALELERFVDKSYATGAVNINKGEYVTGIVLNKGKLVLLNTGKFSEAVPIDTLLDGASLHAVLNSVIKAELDKKLNISDTSAVFAPIEGTYVAGLTLSNGKITALYKYTLPKQQIDSALNANSKNPVENRVIKNAFDLLESALSSEVDTKFVRLANANAYYKASAGDFITAVRQVNGRLAAIETGNYDAKFAALEAKIAELQTKYETEIAALRQQLDNSYVKLKADYTQTITGPVTFNSKINGRITYADVANSSKWT